MDAKICTAIVFCIFSFGTAHAELTEIERDFCEVLADATYQIAKERDKGVSKFEVRNRAYNSIEKPFLVPIISLIDDVYERPWDHPEQEANNFLRICMKTLGEKGIDL